MLLLELEQQRNLSADELQTRARHAMASDAAEVRAAVAYFFGDSCATERSMSGHAPPAGTPSPTREQPASA